MQDLDTNIQKGVQIIFNVLAVIACLGYVLGIFNFGHSPVVIYNNLIATLLVLISFLLYHLRKLNLKTAFIVIVYSAILNIIVATFTDLHDPMKVDIILIESLYMVLILTFAALVINKVHALIIASVYVLMILILTLLLKDRFLSSNVMVITFSVGSYSVVIYYFVGALKKAIIDQKKSNELIFEQHQKMNEVNTLLEERHQRIEEQNERLHAQRDQLNELNSMKDKFFSIIAHDLKNPFNTVLGFTEVLKKKYSVWPEKKTIEIIDIINKTCHVIYELLENLLTWSRSQRGMLPFEPVQITLQSMIKNVISLLNESAIAKNQELSFSVKPEDMTIVADPDMVQSVLRNLLSNAIKYTGHGGSIKIMASKIGDVVQLKVKDNGTGMDDETLLHLFDVKYNKSKEGTDMEAGTGLGLILSHEFVVIHQGKIYAESSPGEGSIFTVELPQSITI